MKIKILYEDKNLLAIDKPAGVAVHPDARTSQKEKTISDWILENYPKLKNVGEPMEVEYKKEIIKILRPGIVHRLDRETSGTLLVAKNQKTFLFLKNQFQNHKVQKVYQAFVYGYVSDPKASLATGKRGVINAPIGRSPNDIRAYTAGRGAKEPIRDAETQYIVLNRFTDLTSEPPLLSKENKKEPHPNPLLIKERELKREVHQFSYLEIYPKTGRTHQIRVHMRYINHPVVSDPLYRGARELALGMKRLALHAKSITFTLPSGEQKTVESSLPSDFKEVIKRYLA